MVKYYPQEKRKGNVMSIRKIAIGIGITIAVIYLAVSLYFMNHFLPNITVNGVDVSYKNAESSEEIFYAKSKDYVLTLLERNDLEETISGKDVNLRFVFNGEFEETIESQNAFLWPIRLIAGKDIELAQVADYDEEMLKSVIDNLSCMDTDSWIESEDAKLGEYDESLGIYSLTAPVYGTCIDAETFDEMVSLKLSGVESELDLAEEGCYIDPVLTEDTKEAEKLLEEASAYAGGVITFEFDDETSVIDADTIKNWLIIDDEYNVSLDEDRVAEYVDALAEQYDTVNSDKTVIDASGDVVSVKAATYGWEMNKEKTIALIIKKINAGQSYTGTVKWTRQAASHGENDYGDTYVDVNLTSQHLRLFVGGEIILETDFVSGNVSKGCKTPGGAYYVTYKEADAVLRGDDYETPVAFWMPFNGGIGLHDATWRSVFGGSIYKTNGSHGCINLPYSAAKKIFNNIEAGCPVLCYYIPGTEPANGKVSEAVSSTEKKDTDKTANSKKKKKTRNKTSKNNTSKDNSNTSSDDTTVTDDADNTSEDTTGDLTIEDTQESNTEE